MTVNELALAYAQALVEYHELDAHVKAAGSSALRQDTAALRDASENIYTAHEALNAACKAAAL